MTQKHVIPAVVTNPGAISSHYRVKVLITGQKHTLSRVGLAAFEAFLDLVRPADAFQYATAAPH